jgi:hypothetical protein
MLSEYIEPEAPVIFPSARATTTMPFSAILPLAFDMNHK